MRMSAASPYDIDLLDAAARDRSAPREPGDHDIAQFDGARDVHDYDAASAQVAADVDRQPRARDTAITKDLTHRVLRRCGSRRVVVLGRCCSRPSMSGCVDIARRTQDTDAADQEEANHQESGDSQCSFDPCRSSIITSISHGDP
jgi:hypothetical protein